jgi:hypothetical protein
MKTALGRFEAVAVPYLPSKKENHGPGSGGCGGYRLNRRVRNAGILKNQGLSPFLKHSLGFF